MLRQIARLTRPLPAAGERACVVAVYANKDDTPIAAADAGFEGVACVDDAARALVVMCDLVEATRLGWARRWAEGLLDFVLWMQLDDGSFVNFVRDFDGARNMVGRTSYPGGAFWHGRAARGLAKAWLVLGDERARDAFARAFRRLETESVASDVRAIHALAVLDLLQRDGEERMRAVLARWCDEIASCRDGDVLLNSAGEGEPHLWGHLQEGVLADAGRLLGRGDLVEIARRSADAFLAPIVASAFDQPRVQPYGVASTVFDVERLHAATGDERYARLAGDARAWFDGRNPAGVPVYDRTLGRVGDGIDDGRVNPQSGAESNIVSAQALFAEVAENAARLLPDGPACFRSASRRLSPRS